MATPLFYHCSVIVDLRSLAKERGTFVRVKKSGKYQYLQIVENQRVDGRVRQRAIATLGRVTVHAVSGRSDRFRMEVWV